MTIDTKHRPTHLVCSLPRGFYLQEDGTLFIPPEWEFQVRWSEKIQSCWLGLNEEERAGLTVPSFPYQEEAIIEFVEAIRTIKKQRGMVDRFRAILPEEHPVEVLTGVVQLIHKLQTGQHPVFHMVSIPCGSFLRQDPEALTPVEIQLTRPYAIGQHLVTNELWYEFGDIKGYLFASQKHFPAIGVDWLTAVQFCNRLSERENLTPAYTIADSVHCDFDADGYRLPTEAEWEFAARGGENTLYAGSNDHDAVAWTRENSGYELQKVAQKQPNGYQLYDMSGLLFEWQWDWFKKLKPTDTVNPTGASTGRAKVIRGGNWYQPPDRSRVDYREGKPIISESNRVGFRLCRTLKD